MTGRLEMRAKRAAKSQAGVLLASPLAAGVLILMASSGPAAGQESGSARQAETDQSTSWPVDGKALFDAKCGMCHGPAGMGTALLSRTRPMAMLEARSDVPAALSVLAARRGIGNMPALPRGELSDGQLQAIAEYLAAGPHGDAL
jgi:mono/diheme cytochrome c family protein